MTLRRDFLAFTAGAVAAKTVLPVAARAETPGNHPDAYLLDLGRQFDEARGREKAAWKKVGSTDKDDDPPYVAVYAEQEKVMALVDMIEEASAVTVKGLLVKLRAIEWCRAGEPITIETFTSFGTPDTTDTRLLIGILDDLAAMGGLSA